MNHCVLEVVVLKALELRYTPDNQTPITETLVSFDPLRPDAPRPTLKVVGWGDNLAEVLQKEVQPGQRLLLEGRLRMNTVARPNGIKEKQAEFSLARVHPVHATTTDDGGTPATPTTPVARTAPTPGEAQTPSWDAGPLVTDEADDEIPF